MRKLRKQHGINVAPRCKCTALFVNLVLAGKFRYKIWRNEFDNLFHDAKLMMGRLDKQNSCFEIYVSYQNMLLGRPISSYNSKIHVSYGMAVEFFYYLLKTLLRIVVVTFVDISKTKRTEDAEENARKLCRVYSTPFDNRPSCCTGLCVWNERMPAFTGISIQTERRQKNN